MDQYSREFIAEQARLRPEGSRARTHGTTISQPTGYAPQGRVGSILYI